MRGSGCGTSLRVQKGPAQSRPHTTTSAGNVALREVLAEVRYSNTDESIEPREYLEEAVSAWLRNQGQGILHMASGTGKRITSLFAAMGLAELQDGRLILVVASPYQHLVDQWVAEMQAFGLTPIRSYESRHTGTDDVVGEVTEFASGARDVTAIVTTHATFTGEHFQSILDRMPGHEVLLVANEVHHLGAPHFRDRLPDQVRARMGLSATPERWYDDEGTKA